VLLEKAIKEAAQDTYALERMNTHLHMRDGIKRSSAEALQRPAKERVQDEASLKCKATVLQKGHTVRDPELRKIERASGERPTRSRSKTPQCERSGR